MIQTATNVFPDDEVIELDWTENSNGNKVLNTPITGKVNCRGSIIKHIDLKIRNLSVDVGSYQNTYQINHFNLKHGDKFSIKPILNWFDVDENGHSLFNPTDDYEYTLTYHGYLPEDTDTPNYDMFFCKGIANLIDVRNPSMLKIGKKLSLIKNKENYYGKIVFYTTYTNTSTLGVVTAYITSYNSSTGQITINSRSSNLTNLINQTNISYKIYTNYFVDRPRVFRLRNKPDMEVTAEIKNNKTGIEMKGNYSNFSETGLLAYKFGLNQISEDKTEIHEFLFSCVNEAGNNVIKIPGIPLSKYSIKKVLGVNENEINLSYPLPICDNYSKYILKITEYSNSSFGNSGETLNNEITEILPNENTPSDIEASNIFHFDKQNNKIVFRGSISKTRYFIIEYNIFFPVGSPNWNYTKLFINLSKSKWYPKGISLYLDDLFSNKDNNEKYYYDSDSRSFYIKYTSATQSRTHLSFSQLKSISETNNNCSLCITRENTFYKGDKKIETDWFYDDNLTYTSLPVFYNQILLVNLDYITKDNKIYNSESLVSPYYINKPLNLSKSTGVYSLGSDYSNHFNLHEIRKALSSSGDTCRYYRLNRYNEFNSDEGLQLSIEDLNNSKSICAFTTLDKNPYIEFIDFEPAGNQNYTYFFIFNNSNCAVIDVNMQNQNGWYIYSLKQTQDDVYTANECWNFNCDIQNSDISTNIGVTVNNSIAEKPIITYDNGNFENGSFSAILETINCPDMTFDNDYKRIEAWKKFISQDCNFLLKSDKGDSWIVNITETPTRSYDHSFDVQPTTINYSWVESVDIQKIAIIGHKSTN